VEHSSPSHFFNKILHLNKFYTKIAQNLSLWNKKSQTLHFYSFSTFILQELIIGALVFNFIS